MILKIMIVITNAGGDDACNTPRSGSRPPPGNPLNARAGATCPRTRGRGPRAQHLGTQRCEGTPDLGDQDGPDAGKFAQHSREVPF